MKSIIGMSASVRAAHLADVLIATEGLDEAHAVNRLMAAGAAAGLKPGEMPRTIASGIGAGRRYAQKHRLPPRA
jgi:hypothetical protein